MKPVSSLLIAAIITTLAGTATAQTLSTQENAKSVNSILPSHIPRIEQAALDLVLAMSQKVANAKTIQFDSIVQSQFPSIDGIPVIYTTAAKLAMQRPNKFDVVVYGNGPEHELLFNGKQLFAYSPDINFVAIADTPGTIDQAAAFAYEKAGLFFPGDDLILEKPYEHITRDVVDAFLVGQTSLVGGVETNIVVLATPTVQGQVWIGVQDNLPYMATWAYLGDPSRPRTTLTYKNWRLNTPIAASTFDANRFAKATVTEFSHPQAPLK